MRLWLGLRLRLRLAALHEVAREGRVVMRRWVWVLECRAAQRSSGHGGRRS